MDKRKRQHYYSNLYFALMTITCRYYQVKCENLEHFPFIKQVIFTKTQIIVYSSFRMV